MPRHPHADDDLLRMALVGYEIEKEKIENKIADIRGQLGITNPTATATEQAAPKRSRLSASARRRIALAQKRRWAEARKEKGEAQKPQEKPKRKFSAAGLRAIREATRKRWAAFHKAKAEKQTAAKVKTAKVKKPVPKRAA